MRGCGRCGMADFLRPEVRAFAGRWAEMLVAGGVVLAGLWVFTFGGWFFRGLGLLLGFAGLAGVLIAWRRMKFRRDVAQPGIVEVIEGQVRYFGPHGGGFVALREVVEVSLIRDLSGQTWWRMREAGGNVVAVPSSAAGAEALFDAFSSLPDVDMGALADALERGGTPEPGALWRRPDSGVLPFRKGP